MKWPRSLKQVLKHKNECIYCLYYVLPLIDMAKIFKLGTERLSDII